MEPQPKSIAYTQVVEKQLLQLVMDNLPECIFGKERQSAYVGCSQKFAKASGFRTYQYITERKRAGLALTQLNEELKQRVKLRKLRQQLDALIAQVDHYLPFAMTLLALARQFDANGIEALLTQFLRAEANHG